MRLHSAMRAAAFFVYSTPQNSQSIITAKDKNRKGHRNKKSVTTSQPLHHQKTID